MGKDWRKNRERLMDDEDIFSAAELRRRRLAAYWAMQRNDEKLEKEQKKLKKQGYCPKCRMILTTSGTCPRDCQ